MSELFLKVDKLVELRGQNEIAFNKWMGIVEKLRHYNGLVTNTYNEMFSGIEPANEYTGISYETLNENWKVEMTFYYGSPEHFHAQIKAVSDLSSKLIQDMALDMSGNLEVEWGKAFDAYLTDITNYEKEPMSLGI